MSHTEPSSPPEPFTYDRFIGRNLGFVDAAEQERIRRGHVFVCGVGGMGGACLMSLVRAGLGHVTLADIDHFEVSNLNRQLFADLTTVGSNKVDATVEQIRQIHPGIEVTTYDGRWVDELDTILATTDIVINGMDDIPRGIHLYRRAAVHGATVIDAYTSPLPSVTVVRPRDPRPEERLRFPTVGRPWSELDEEEISQCSLRELEYVMTHSQSRHHIHLDIAVEMVSGQRPRMSFAPMVITTGNLMAFEAINRLLGRGSGTDYRGYFFNPWTARVERPRNPLVAAALGFLVRRFLRQQIGSA